MNSFLSLVTSPFADKPATRRSDSSASVYKAPVYKAPVGEAMADPRRWTIWAAGLWRRRYAQCALLAGSHDLSVRAYGFALASTTVSRPTVVGFALGGGAANLACPTASAAEQRHAPGGGLQPDPFDAAYVSAALACRLDHMPYRRDYDPGGPPMT